MNRYNLSKPEDIKQLRKAVNFLCSNKFWFVNADDMFQSICVKILERPELTSNIEHLFIDVLRIESGRSDASAYELKTAVLQASRYCDAMAKETVDSPETMIQQKLDVEKMLNSLEDVVARQIIYDVYFYDWQRNEVADKLNTHATTVSLRLRWAYEDIREEFSPENLKTTH